MTRSVTFAGTLGFGDAQLVPGDPSVIVIDRKPRSADGISGEAIDRIVKLVADAGLDATLIRRPAMVQDAEYRSARPGKTVRVPGFGPYAGYGIETACRRLVAEHGAKWAPGWLDGRDLEAWLLPVTEFSLEFLLTPAGDYP